MCWGIWRSMERRGNDMKNKIVEFYIEKSERTSEYFQLVAIDEDGNKYQVDGLYCGGIPAVAWRKLEIESDK